MIGVVFVGVQIDVFGFNALFCYVVVFCPCFSVVKYFNNSDNNSGNVE